MSSGSSLGGESSFIYPTKVGGNDSVEREELDNLMLGANGRRRQVR